MLLRLTSSLVLLAGLSPAAALAQSQFKTPRGDSASGSVLMCLNDQGYAVTCSPGGSGAATSNYSLESGGNLAALLARTPVPNSAGQEPVNDPNNLALSAPGAPFAVGSTVAPGRALLVDCSVAGRLTLQLAGSANTVPYQVAASTQVVPLAVTQVTSSGGASCTYQNFYQ